MELLGSSPIPRSFVASCVRLQLRPLPSTGVNRFPRYYEPLRHPKRPGLSLASCQLIHDRDHRSGLPVLRLVSYAYMPSPLPRQVRWSLFARPSPPSAAFPCETVRSAPAITFSGPAQRSLTLRPARSPSHQCDPLHRKLRRFGYPLRRFGCYRVERTSSRVGVAPTEVQRLSRRTVS